MKKTLQITVVSDLHLEYLGKWETAKEQIGYAPTPEDKEYGVLVLAGDIVEIGKILPSMDFFEQVSKDYKYVVYVPGNHEYYNKFGWAMANLEINALRALHHLSNIHLIGGVSTPDHVCLDGVNFIGATLWADLSSMESSMQRSILKWPDFRWVHPESGLTQDLETLGQLHKQDLESLDRSLRDFVWERDEPVFVCTHFGPTTKFQDRQYVRKPMGQFFYTDLDTWMMPGGIAHSKNILGWSYGHTHATIIKKLHGLQLLCNPHGYMCKGERENLQFSWGAARRIYTLKTQLTVK